jgi:hypothetical protein
MTQYEALQVVLDAALAYENLNVCAGLVPDADLELAIYYVKEMLREEEHAA